MDDNKDIRVHIIKKLEKRIEILKGHRHDSIVDENQYGELNQALSKVINVALTKELEGLKIYIENL